MKAQNILFTCLLSCYLIACQSSSILTLSNKTSQTIVAQFHAPYFIDSIGYNILPGEEKLIQTIALANNSRQESMRLRTIVIKNENKQIALRFSNSYLELENWKLSLPLSIPNPEKFQKFPLVDKINAINNHSYYFLVQEYFNRQRYSECLVAIEDISNLITPKLFNITQSNRTSNIIEMETTGELQGYYLLAYLSATKLGAMVIADRYWSNLQQSDSRLTKMLKENDFEILHQ